MGLTERIEQILKLQKLSSSQFADQIGVQRSSMSHIISGRNKPSLDFVNKVLLKFNFINSDWLLFGKGPMTKELRQKSLFDDIDNEIDSKHAQINSESSDVDSEPTPPSNGYKPEPAIDETKHHSSIKSDLANTIIINNDIDRIVIFYKDGTFTQHRPRI